MKKYIGTKIVEAEKAFKVGDVIYSNENNEIDAFMLADGEVAQMGYKMRYPDGYESFSPKAVFEKAYLPVDVFEEKERDLEAEYAELAEQERKMADEDVCEDSTENGKNEDIVDIHFVLYENGNLIGSVKGNAATCIDIMVRELATIAKKAMVDSPIEIRKMFIELTKLETERNLKKALNVE